MVALEALAPPEDGALVHPQHHRDVGRRHAVRHEEQRLATEDDAPLGLLGPDRALDLEALLGRQPERHGGSPTVRPVRPRRGVDHVEARTSKPKTWPNF
jgi:hypothetical protein